MRTLTAILMLLCAVPTYACVGPAEQADSICSFCEDYRVLELYNGPGVAQETPFLQSLQAKCNAECAPENIPSDTVPAAE